MTNRERIARKIAQDMREGEFVNFGHGIPYSVGQYIDPDLKLFIQNEPGVVCFGMGTPADPGDYEMRDSVNRFVKDNVGGSFIDTASSFAMIRGGHVDKTVLGALQVDQHANIANWMTPGKPASGIGGAMDLCVGAGQVIVAMEMRTKTGAPKLLRDCTYPLTAAGVVTKVYTEMGVFTVSPEEGFVLIEKFSDYSVEDIQAAADAPIHIAEDVQEIQLSVPL